MHIHLGEGAAVLLDAVCFRLGVSRSAFISAAIEQAIARYLHGVEDPLRPIPSYVPRTGYRIVVNDADFVKRMEAAEPLTSSRYVEHIATLLRRVRPVPGPDYKVATDRFNPDDPSTYRARKTKE